VEKHWRALEEPAREVYFPQKHQPGKLSQSDFTHMSDLGVTLGAIPFDRSLLPSGINRLVNALLDGSFLERRENILAFGNPGTGKFTLLKNSLWCVRCWLRRLDNHSRLLQGRFASLSN
jgi:hypothetical protein